MFNLFNSKASCEFKSNSKVHKVPVMVPLEENGKVTNHLEFKIETLDSPLAGSHFEESIHGLRAKLNLGIKISEVPNLNIDDFDVAFNKINAFGSKVDAYVLNRNAQVETSAEETK